MIEINNTMWEVKQNTLYHIEYVNNRKNIICEVSDLSGLEVWEFIKLVDEVKFHYPDYDIKNLYNFSGVEVYKKNRSGSTKIKQKVKLIDNNCLTIENESLYILIEHHKKHHLFTVDIFINLNIISHNHNKDPFLSEYFDDWDSVLDFIKDNTNIKINRSLIDLMFNNKGGLNNVK